MFGRSVPLVMISGMLVLGTAMSCCNADLIELKSGGKIRGKISTKANSPAGSVVTIKTLAGTMIVVQRDDVRKIARRSLLVEEYEIRAHFTPNKVGTQWGLAEWCREKRLGKQRKVHLAKVVELDPDHRQAHLGLGHRQHHGKWITREEEMRTRGYVKYKGRYVTTQSMDLINKKEAQRDLQRDWHQRIRRWHGWLNHRKPERRQRGWEPLEQITDPDAVRSLARFFQDSRHTEFRELYISILSRIPGNKPVKPLVIQSLHDVSDGLRTQSFEAIRPNRHALAVPFYVPELRHPSNTIVNRAAEALGKLRDDSVVPFLVDALVTTHRYRVRVLDNSGLAFGSDGSFGSPNTSVTLPPNIELMLRTGQLPDGVIVLQPNRPGRTRVVTIERRHRNREAKEALAQLTGESFGYDKRAWRLWWTRQKNGTELSKKGKGKR